MNMYSLKEAWESSECAHSRGTNRRERGRGSSLSVKMAGHGVRGFFSAPSALPFHVQILDWLQQCEAEIPSS